MPMAPETMSMALAQPGPCTLIGPARLHVPHLPPGVFLLVRPKSLRKLWTLVEVPNSFEVYTSMTSGNSFLIWNILGFITAPSSHSGLAVETASFSVAPDYQSIYILLAMVLLNAKDWIEDESWYHLVWVISLLDCYATISTAFRFIVIEKEIDIEMRWFHAHTPSEFYPPLSPESLRAFSYYIEILGIPSRIHQFLKQPADISALLDVKKWQGEYRQLDSQLTS